MREAIEHGFWSTVGAVVIVIVVTFVCLFAFDKWSGTSTDAGDASRAAEQGVQNGRNACRFFEAVSDVIADLASGGLTDVQQTKVDHMQEVARSCNALPDNTKGEP